MNLAPSRKTILLGITCILVLGAIFYFSKKTTPTTYSLDSRGLSQGAEFFVEDSDGDGVPDWEEILWGTDPFNPETVLGISDFDKISSLKEEGGRISSLQKEHLEKTPTKNNPSDLIAVESIINLLRTQAESGINAGHTRSIAEQTAEKIFSLPAPESKITAKDLKIISGPTTAKQTLDYLNSLHNAEKTLRLRAGNISFFGIYEFEQPEYKEVVKNLHAYAKSSYNIMKEMPVPNDFAQIHLRIAKANEKLSEEFLIMANADKDLFSTISAINRISFHIDEITFSLTEIRTRASANHGIIFSKESGSYVMKK